MTTTVVASRHGLSLTLLPAAGPTLDREALRRVFARHGLSLIDGADLASANEFIAAEGLEPAAAVRLVDDLRAIGLTARVVNRTGLTGSRRVGNAIVAQFAIGMAGFIALSAGSVGIVEGNPTIAVIMLVLGALLMLAAAFNAFTLQRRGGYSLHVAGTAAGPLLLTEQLSQLADQLPSHLADPMIARAEKLQAHAQKDPDGPAAQELQSLLDEFRTIEAQAAADEARALREELARARQALRETQGR
jgi:hypothetical protein